MRPHAKDQSTTAYALVSGYFRWWRQVLDSTRRKLSRRFRTPLTFGGRAIFAYQS
jgi:hypothetical protein